MIVDYPDQIFLKNDAKSPFCARKGLTVKVPKQVYATAIFLEFTIVFLEHSSTSSLNDFKIDFHKTLHA